MRIAFDVSSVPLHVRNWVEEDPDRLRRVMAQADGQGWALDLQSDFANQHFGDPLMLIRQPTPEGSILVAIDVSKARNGGVYGEQISILGRYPARLAASGRIGSPFSEGGNRREEAAPRAVRAVAAPILAVRARQGFLIRHHLSGGG